MNKILFVLMAVVISACGTHGKDGAAGSGKDSAAAASEKPATEGGDSVDARTPVTVIQVDRGGLDDYIELNAVSAFLQKSYVKAIANGYLESADVYPGKNVEKGQTLFTLQTKESKSIGNFAKSFVSSLG